MQQRILILHNFTQCTCLSFPLHASLRIRPHCTALYIFCLTRSNVFNFLFFKARDENFKANFTQYGLGSYFVDVLVADAGRLGLREVPLFDAIVTDRE